MAAKAIQAFQLTEEYNTVLFSWYYKGFELLRWYMVKHPSGVNLEKLEFKEVGKEMEVDKTAQAAVALEESTPESNDYELEDASVNVAGGDEATTRSFFFFFFFFLFALVVVVITIIILWWCLVCFWALVGNLNNCTFYICIYIVCFDFFTLDSCLFLLHETFCFDSCCLFFFSGGLRFTWCRQ